MTPYAQEGMHISDEVHPLLCIMQQGSLVCEYRFRIQIFHVLREQDSDHEIAQRVLSCAGGWP